MEETIDLKECFNIIKKNLSKIISITIIVGVISGGIGLLSKDKPIEVFKEDRIYEASSNVIITYDIEKAENTIFKNNQDKETIDIINRNLNYNKSLLTTYAELLKSNKNIEKVINNLNLEDDIDEIKSNITITPIGESQILNIKVQNKYPKVAANIANELPNVFEHKDLMLEITDKAIEPTKPMPKLDEKGQIIPDIEENEVVAKPNKMKKVVMNTIIGLVLGFMISLFLVFLLEYMDNKLRTEKQIQLELGLPVLGVIPNVNSNKGGRK